jgi:2-dehydropantoate 2-reductase
MMVEELQRVLVVGAGSLGSVYGGFLARSGLDVQLLAREPHARAIRDQGGLRVSSFDGEWLAPVRATWRPEEVTPADLVIVLVKSQDTAAALESLDHVADEVRVAVSFQNGIDEHGVLASWAGADHVIGGMSMVGATLDSPGHVRHTLAGLTYVGETPTGTSARTEAVGRMLEAAGLEATVTDRIASAEWSKVVHGAPSMSLTALTRLWFHEVFLAPELAEVFLEQVLEGVAIAAAAGVEVDDWPGLLPIRTMATEPRARGLEHIRGHGQMLVDRGMTNIRISMLQSVERGRHIEVESMLGVLARAADAHGVAAPATRTQYLMLAGLDRYLS